MPMPLGKTKREVTAMHTMEWIVHKYREFDEFLNELNINELLNQYGADELESVVSQLYKINLRQLPFEISEILSEAKLKRECPELLGVINYPELAETSHFLNENEQKAVDDYLGSLDVGEYLTGLWRFVLNNKKKIYKLEDFLTNKEIVEEVYFAVCPECGKGNLTRVLKKNQKEELDVLLQSKNTLERTDALMEYLEFSCLDCDDEVDIEQIQTIPYKTYLKLKKSVK